MNCIDCSQLITKLNDSREHLILQAAGGRKRVRGVLCRKCNSTTGHEWDDELARQLAPLCSLFSIKRQRGKVPLQKVTISGQTFYRRFDGVLLPDRPDYKEIPGDNGAVQVQIQARTIEEARRMLEGAARKHANIDVKKTLASVQVEQRYPTEPAQLDFGGVGGDLAGRSMVKSALCFATSNGVDPQACTDAVSYLKNTTADPCFGFYYQRDLLQDRPKAVPLHYLAVSSRGTDGQLLAYVEFFAVYRVVIRLAQNYTGPDIHAAYAIDPISGKELDLSFALALSRADIAACYEAEYVSSNSIIAAFHEVMPVAIQNDFNRELKRVTTAAIKSAWAEVGPVKGEVFTAEHAKKISQLAAEKCRPFLVSYLIQRRVPITP